MKTTGIIRRIDDLGRLVIPKELRRSLRIKNGESLEIFVDGEDIVLKKYSPMESIEDAAIKYVDSFNKVIKHSVIVTDKDKVIAASGTLKKKYLGKNIKMRAKHYASGDYHYIIGPDGDECCNWEIEIRTSDTVTEYPKTGKNIYIVGEYKYYKDGGKTYYYLELLEC